jgi:SAM-dependent methyltransferase
MLKKKYESCPLCQGNNIKEIGIPEKSREVIPFIDRDYVVVKCIDCKFYYVTPSIIFTKEQWQKLYGEEYFFTLTDWNVKQRARDRNIRLNWLQEAHDGEIKNFLDIGCGEGHVAYDAFRLGWETHCIDIYDNRMSAAKNENIHFHLGDLLSASYPDNHFDGVYMDSVLEHLLDPERYLKEIHRILRNGGVVYIGIPNEDSIINDLKKVVRNIILGKKVSSRMCPFKSPFHVVGFTKKSILTTLQSNNFYVHRIRNFAGIREWKKFKPFSKMYIIYLMMVPLYLIGAVMGKMKYLDTIVLKKTT